MTETFDIPKDIGRNDPCPCGSGKKYKKCHYRTHKLQSTQQQKTQEAQDLINAETIPWTFYKILAQTNADNIMGLYYKLLHDQGPLAAKYKNEQAMLLALDAGTEVFPAAAAFDLLLYRLDEPETHLLLVKGMNDPRTTQVHAQVITLRPNELDAQGESREAPVGPRIWDVKTFTKAKSEMENAKRLTLDELGYQWNPVAAAE